MAKSCAASIARFARGGRECLEPPTHHDQLRFLEDAQITGQLEHPNIVPIHDIALRDNGEAEPFSMKLIEGGTLHALLAVYPEGEGPTDRELEHLLQIFLKVCDAISFAHSRRVTTRFKRTHHGRRVRQLYDGRGLAKMPRRGARVGDGRNRAESGRFAVDGAAKGERGEVYGTPAYMRWRKRS